MLAAALAGPAAAQAPKMAVHASTARTAALTSLHQEVTFDAPPARVYAALMSSKDFAAFSGMPATIEPTPGGHASLFGGLIDARNVELVSGKRIVQAWRPVEDFPPGVYSLVKFELTPSGKGTKVVLDHTGFPPGHYDHLNSGWPERYWAPLKKYLAQGPK
jgi:activator of HSP90 ATPase